GLVPSESGRVLPRYARMSPAGGAFKRRLRRLIDLSVEYQGRPEPRRVPVRGANKLSVPMVAGCAGRAKAQGEHAESANVDAPARRQAVAHGPEEGVGRLLDGSCRQVRELF